MCTRVCGCVWKLDAPDPRAYGPYHHPLVGDPVYGGRPRPPKVLRKHLSPRCVSLTAVRYSNHAASLSPRSPASKWNWHAPIPQDMVELIEVMRADFEEHKDEVDWL